jgi:prepilin-type processing-associated H-X9-DG protein
LLLLFVVLGSSLAVFGPGGIVVFAFVVGLAVYLHTFRSCLSLVYLALAVLCLMCLLGLPAIGAAKRGGRQAQCCINLSQIAMALQEYHKANGCFPPAYIADKNGKPMHSWRVLILPYLDQGPLYKMYSFNEPWDGPNNKKLLVYRVSTYECPSDPSTHGPGTAQTNYVAVVGPKAAWAGDKPRKLDALRGEAFNTVMIVEVANSGISWTEPRDLSLDAFEAADSKSSVLVPSSNHEPHSDFFYIYEPSSSAHAAMADGHVRYLPPGSLSAEHLPKLLQVNGCKEEEINSLEDFYNSHRRPNWPNIAALAVWLLSVGTLLTFAVRSRKPRSVSPPPPAN